jgi:hypothetical protein
VKLGPRDVDTNRHSSSKARAFLSHLVDATVDVLLFHLEIGDSVTE